MLLNKFIYNEGYYLANNPEVFEIVHKGEMKAADHWTDIGIHKGLTANSMFDVRYYLDNNSDLKEQFNTDYKAAAKHWLEQGIGEGRKSSEKFHVQAYLARYNDLQKAFGTSYMNAAKHWIMHGEREGRIAIEQQASAKFTVYQEDADGLSKDEFIQKHITRLYQKYVFRSRENLTKENEFYKNEVLLESTFRQKPELLKVSIVLPSWNRKNIIRKAIDSVLNQTYKNFELIIVDDGSTDGTVSFLKDEYLQKIEKGCIRIIENSHKGVSAARNVGLSASTGDLIAYLDSDNEWQPNFLLLMVNHLSEHSTADSAYCGILILDSTKENYRILFQENFDEDMIRVSNFIDLNCFVHRKKLFEKLGGFNESLKRLVDWDLVLKYTENNPPLACKAVLVKYYMLENVLHITKTVNLHDNFFKINDTKHGSQNVFKEYKHNSFIEATAQDRLDSLKIAYVLWQFPVLSETFILNEIRWLVNNEYDVKVYYKNIPDKIAELDFNVSHERIENSDDLVAKLKQDSRNIIHGHFIYPTVIQLVYPAAEQAQIPFTFVGHGVDMFHYQNVGRMGVHLIAKSHYFKKVFALGHFHRLYYMQYQVPEKKIAITPQAVPTEFFGETKISLQGKFKYSVCCITRYVEKKGIKYLIKAARLLPDIKINIYGYGELEEVYESIIKEEGVNNVNLLGVLPNREEVLKVLLENDLYVLPCVRAENGDMDGVPTVFMESLAAGVPIVTTNISSISDIIIDGKTGFIAKQHDYESLAEKIKEFYELSEQAVYAMKLAGRQRVSMNHNINHSMRRNISVWQGKGVDILLVSYNAFEELQEIVRRIYKYTAVDFKLTIVDNNSSDKRVVGFLEDLKTKVDNLNLVLLEENIYCGPASNIALQKSENKYSIYLCSKEGFVLKHNWEWDMIKYMDENPNVGIAGHLAYSPSFYDAENLQKLELFKNFRNQDFVKNNPAKKFKHVQGGVYIIRNEMVEQIGGFNEKTPQDLMDVEYSYYVESMGWKLGSIQNLYSITVKTRPLIDSLIDENTIVAHPLTLSNIAHFEQIGKDEIKKCNICNWSNDNFIENNSENICGNCEGKEIHRTIYRFLASSDFPYRKLKLLSTLPKFKGEGEIRKMFNYQGYTVAEIPVVEGTFDLIILYLNSFVENAEIEKIIKKVNSLTSEKGKIIVNCTNSKVLIKVKEAFKKKSFSVKSFSYNSSALKYSTDIVLLVEKSVNAVDAGYNDIYIDA